VGQTAGNINAGRGIQNNLFQLIILSQPELGYRINL
jgi:hypothetical protein